MTVDPDTARLLVDEEDEAGARVWDGQRWLRDGLPLAADSADPALEFSPEGRLEGALDRDGVRRTYGYTPEGRLARVAWPDGREVLVSYDRNGRVEEIRGPGTRVERYRWGDALTVQRYPGGRIERQPINPGSGADRAYAVRDGAGREVRSFYAGDELVAWEDPRGLRTTLDRSPERLRIQLPTGGSWVVEADDSGRLAQLTGPRGGQWRWTWSPHGVVSRRDPTGRMERSTFDEQGRLLSRSFGGRRYDLLWSEAGPIRGLRAPSGAETLVERDEQGQVSALVDAAGSRLELDWERGQVATIRRRDGGVWSLDRDPQGRVTALDSPEGWRLSVRRDSRGHIVEIKDSSAGRTRLFRDLEGRITQVTAPDGRKTGLVRDGHGAVTAVRRADGSTVRIERDASGEIRRVALGDSVVDIRRDPRGLPTRAGPIQWQRDLRGGVVGLQTGTLDLALGRDLSGRLSGVSAGAWTLGIQHDAAGFPVAWRGSDGELVVQRDANGLVTTESDGTEETRALRGPRGLLQRVSLGPHQWRLSRDAAGRVLRVAGPDGLKGGLDRDAAGRTTLVRYPTGALKKVSYEGSLVHIRVEEPSGSPLLQRTEKRGPAGELEWIQENDAGRTTYQYDPLGALVAIEREQEAWSWGVDAVEGPQGQLALFDEAGRLREARIAPGIPAWGVAAEVLQAFVDEAGRVRGYSGELGAAELAFDAAGRLERLSTAGQVWRVQWDPLGRLRAVTDPTGASRTYTWVPGSRGANRDLLRVGDDQLWLPGFAEPVAVRTPGGVEAIVAVDQLPRFVADAAGQVLAIATTPAGRADSGASRSAGARGGISLFAGGPLVFGSVMVDPVSGRPIGGELGWPWEVRAAMGPLGHDKLDPTAWQPVGPWHEPLRLLADLGEVDFAAEEQGVQILAPSVGVPWLPAGLDTDLVGAWTPPPVLPVQEDPLVLDLLTALMPGGRPPDESWFRSLVLADVEALSGDLPPGLGIPGLERVDPGLSTGLLEPAGW